MLNYFSAGIDLRRQILTSKYDPHIERVKHIFKVESEVQSQSPHCKSIHINNDRRLTT